MVYRGSRPKDAIRKYFPMPNAIFNLNLNAGEISVYAYLMFCENRKTYQCYPSFATIGKAVGMSRPTVKKHVDSLVDKGLIYTEPTSVFTKAGKSGMEVCCIRFVLSKKHRIFTMKGSYQCLRRCKSAANVKQGGDRTSLAI